MKGRVFDVQRFCVHDGPGIRTTVFLAGCSLRCAWCHNPEAFSGKSARWRAPEDVLAEVLEDRDYYVTSGGGLTVSGGEPLLQPAFVRALLELAGREGLHRCVQTAGAVPEAALREVLPVVELFQFDLKHLEPVRHRALTGQDNTRILANARWLAAQGACVEFRRPLVPGFNDAPGELERLAAFVRGLGGVRLSLVPYQATYLGKYAQLGLPARCSGVKPPTRSDLETAVSSLERHGLAVAVDG